MKAVVLEQELLATLQMRSFSNVVVESSKKKGYALGDVHPEVQAISVVETPLLRTTCLQ
jgi:hypothetical protein